MQVENAEFTVISKWDKVGGDGIFWFVEDAIREILQWGSLLFVICMGGEDECRFRKQSVVTGAGRFAFLCFQTALKICDPETQTAQLL